MKSRRLLVMPFALLLPVVMSISLVTPAHGDPVVPDATARARVACQVKIVGPAATTAACLLPSKRQVAAADGTVESASDPVPSWWNGKVLRLGRLFDGRLFQDQVILSLFPTPADAQAYLQRRTAPFWFGIWGSNYSLPAYRRSSTFTVYWKPKARGDSGVVVVRRSGRFVVEVARAEGMDIYLKYGQAIAQADKIARTSIGNYRRHPGFFRAADDPASPPPAQTDPIGDPTGYPATREGVVNAWADAWIARDRQAAARYEYHPGPGLSPYDRFTWEDNWRETVSCRFQVVCYFWFGEPPNGLYLREVGGLWKVIGVYFGGNALEPSLIKRDFLPSEAWCTTKSVWLRDQVGSNWSSILRIPAGSALRPNRQDLTSDNATPTVLWGPWWGVVSSQEAGLVRIPGTGVDATQACQRIAIG